MRQPRSKYEAFAAQVAEEHRKQRAVETFIKNVRDLGVITEFDEYLGGCWWTGWL